MCVCVCGVHPQAEAALEGRLQQLQSRLCAREGEAALLRTRVGELRGEAAHSASIAQGMATARAEAEAQVRSTVHHTSPKPVVLGCCSVYPHHESLTAVTRGGGGVGREAEAGVGRVQGRWATWRSRESRGQGLAAAGAESRAWPPPGLRQAPR